MTISEAMKDSKETGRAFQRTRGPGFHGWLQWCPNDAYTCLTAMDLMADDWEMIGERPPRGDELPS